ncbi:MAG: MarR family winged helix-turn-helix transcriptional regulator [Alphaproteobacteria bacterium]|nr:MarR family winged helix-turn-helix transcriptional regulator [Alphaproteobacteria bacterium]
MDRSRTLGFLINDVGRLFRLRFDRRAKALGLKLIECKTLGYLLRNEGINQVRLAELLEIEPMTLVHLLDRMEKAGWVERRPDPRDRRARTLFLGAKAKPVFAVIWRMADETRNEALTGLSEGEREAFVVSLERIRSNLLGFETVTPRARARRPTLPVAQATRVTKPKAAKRAAS